MVTKERQQISYGKLTSKEKYANSEFIPDQIKSHLAITPFYLYIYVPAEDIIKVSIFACETANIKKILIRLKAFSPELVKGISSVLKNFNLGEGTIHTTGLCFESTQCYYETYVDGSVIEKKGLTLDQIKKEFMKVDRVEEVQIKEIPLMD